MKKQYTLVFWITLAISIALIITGFLIPPRGVIDGTILTAVGELFLWNALAFAAKALVEGRKATIKHKGTEIEIGNTEEED